MKKLICLLLTVATLILSLISLTSCGEDDGIPDGMQIAGGNSSSGYLFFAPAEWIVSYKDQNVDAVYISKLINNSVTFTEITFTEDEIAKLNLAENSCSVTECETYEEGTDTLEHYFLYHYFDDCKSQFPESLSVQKHAVAAPIGQEGYRADRAVKYEFSYKYKDVSITETQDVLCGFTQYYVIDEGKTYLLTYFGVKELAQGQTVSNYENYYEYFTTIVDNFKFFNPVGNPSQITPEYTVDEDGYKLISTASKSGFDFYMHPDYEATYSSGMVKATHPDGSNVNMTIATSTGVAVHQYIQRRIDEIEAIIGSEVTFITDVLNDEGEIVASKVPQSQIGQVPKNGTNTRYNYAYEVEYTYEFGGEKYRVYQIYACEGFFLWPNGYIFTYTAEESNYDKHIDEIKSMRDKVYFR